MYFKKCFLLAFLTQYSFAIWNKYFVLYSNNWRFANDSRKEQNMQKIECLTLCDRTLGCEMVNHNSDTKTCELLKPGSWTPTSVSETESHWVVYYKADRYVSAINVWQSSTFTVSTYPNWADLAVDGNRNNDVWPICAHTNDYSSTWAMEFDHLIEVAHVIVYFWNSDPYNYRNTNLRFLVSETRQDSDNSIGTDCATYIGPPASPLPPVKITCTTPVTGRFLKVIFNQQHHLVLCEVEVFST